MVIFVFVVVVEVGPSLDVITSCHGFSSSNSIDWRSVDSHVSGAPISAQGGERWLDHHSPTGLLLGGDRATSLLERVALLQ